MFTVNRLCLVGFSLALCISATAWAGGEWNIVGPGGGGGLQCITAAEINGESAIYVGGDVSGVWRKKGNAEWEPVNRGMTGAMVNDIVVDPQEPLRIFAGTNRGVFRSENGGDEWEQIPFLTNRVVSYLGIYADADTKALYAATATSQLEKPAADSKLHVSYDNGSNWTLLKDFGSLWVSSIQPVNGTTILAGVFSGVVRDTKTTDFANDGGVFISQDSGLNWQEINGNLPAKQAFDLVVDKDGMISVILPAINGIWQSSDWGATWTSKNQGLYIQEDFYQLYINPYDKKKLFVTAGRIGTNVQAKGVWRFDEENDTWVRLTRIGAPDDNVQKAWNYLWVEADANEVVVDPVNPERLFYAGRTIHRSDDNGSTWVGDAFMENSGWWTNTGHCENFAYYLKRHPVNKNLMFMGDGDWRIGRSIDGGKSWQMTASNLPWGFDLSSDMVFDVENNAIFAAVGGAGGKVIKSVDDGITWVDMKEGLPVNDNYAFIRRIAIDLTTPETNRVLYALCARNGVYRSDDGAVSWNKLINAPSSAQNIQKLDYCDIDLHPSENGVIYLCLNTNPAGTGGFYKGTNYGENWQKLNLDGPIGFVDLAIKPDDPQIMLATSEAGLYRSGNGGINWTKVYDIAVNMGILNSAVCFDKQNPDVVYVGASSYAAGLAPFQNWFLRSNDAGLMWENVDSPIGGGMQRIIFIETQSTGEILVGTSGFGGYTYEYIPPADSVACDKSINWWYSAPPFVFTNTLGFGNDISKYRYAWDNNYFYEFNDTESVWDSGDLLINPASDGEWYFHFIPYSSTDNQGTSQTLGPFFYDAIPPVPPVLVSPESETPLSASNVIFVWDSGNDSSSITYTLQIDDMPEFVSPFFVKTGLLSVSYTLTDDEQAVLDDGTTYYWRVTAIDGAGNGANADYKEFMLVSAVGIPVLAKPGHMQNGVQIPVDFEWYPIEDIYPITYSIEVALDSTMTDIAYVYSNIPAVSLTVENLPYDTTFYWRIRAVRINGDNPFIDIEVDWSDTWQFTTISYDGKEEHNMLAVSPDQLEFTAYGSTGIMTEMLLVYNTIEPAISGDLTWNLTENMEWLTLGQKTGSYEYLVEVPVEINIAGLGPGMHYGVIVLDAFNAQNTPIEIPVQLEILPLEQDVEYIPPADSVICDKSTNFWYSTSPFRFTNTAGFGNEINRYYYAWNSNSYYIFNGTESVWDTGDLSFSPEIDGEWYFHYVPYSFTDNPGISQTLGPYCYDATSPSYPVLVSPGLDTPISTTETIFVWESVSDPSSITYTMQIDDMPDFITPILVRTGLSSISYTLTGAEQELLVSGVTYYWRITAVDGAGNSAVTNYKKFILSIDYILQYPENETEEAINSQTSKNKSCFLKMIAE
ncbi:MAG: hypothetical protein HZA48_12410 [Planctomycetes bacterium]|nr:hypothetical protein [Planctomycetota bacterium]